MLCMVAAWFGSLANGPFADYIGRKMCIIVAVVVFLVGSAIQAGAVNIPMLFIGKLEIRANIACPIEVYPADVG